MLHPAIKSSTLRLAMLGMVDGNGHPYSWSAIINGEYDPKLLAESPYPVISEYLNAQPRESLGITGAQVTHIWCDDRAQAEHVSKTTFIPNLVAQSIDVIGHVDAVIIPTDKGWEHLDRARPFIEAGIPVFIDKPLTDSEEHLRQFVQWHEQGKWIASSSAMRYAREFVQLRTQLNEVGDTRLITTTTCKSWERYGIHALEAAYPLLRAGGFVSVTNTGSESSNLVHIHHEDGAEVLVAAIDDMYGSFGCVNVYGTKGTITARFQDTFRAFRDQLVAVVNSLRSGQHAVPFEQTVELMKIIIAGIRSRKEGGRRVMLSEILA